MSDYEIRRSTDDDLPAILALMSRTLGWRPEDPNEELFRWKHVDNVFGPSPAWVAVDDRDGIIGFRTFMRWEFLQQGEVVRAVRAVDTATHPAHQGKGIFKALTLQAIEELREEGVAFVFNTPNDQSRPGYLKMGWEVVGRPSVSFRPRSATSVVRLLRSRVPADLWSLPSSVGVPVALSVLDGACDVAGCPSAPRLTTRRSGDYLRWRYGLEPLHYRALPVGKHGSVVIFRVRRRGPALEVAVCDIVGPGLRGGFAGELLRATGADYLMAVGRPTGMVPLPGQGPVLTRRALREDAAAGALDGADLSLGDLELF